MRRSTSFALLAALALSLSACTSLGLPDYGYPGNSRYPDNRRNGPVYDRQDDYRRTPEYRNVGREANRYTDLLDRELRLDGGQERTIERIIESRAENLLRQTHPRDHRRVYPFPRDQRLSSTARRWWDGTDREINRYLHGDQRAEYRTIGRDLERYGRYDARRYERDRRYDRRDDRYDRRDRDRHDDRRGQGPSYCRSGAGHPVFGRQWCYDRGYYPEDRDDRDRRRDDDRGWGRDHD